MAYYPGSGGRIGCGTKQEPSCGARRSVQAVLSLIDTTDPSWPTVAGILQEFAAADIELDAVAVSIAVKLGQRRWAAEDMPEEDRQATLAEAASIVYYIRRGDLIKIGTTVDPRQRFSDLLPDEILAVEPGSFPDERRRHRQFHHLRCAGEHFRDSPELRDHIQRIRSLHGDPDPTWQTSVTAGKRRVWCLPLPKSTETVTAADAEVELGIKDSTLRGWVHRGRLRPAGRDHRRRHVFYREQLIVLRDSARTRMAAHI